MIKFFVLSTALVASLSIGGQGVFLVKDSTYESNSDSSTIAAQQASDPKALKAIMNSKKYKKAEALVRNNLSNLNNADRAKAYNKLVDLAMVMFDDFGFDPKKTEMAFNAVAAGIECDKYDQLPDQQGIVSPKFASNNALRLWDVPRNYLFIAGSDSFSAKKYSLARKYWQLFVESDAVPLFKNCDRTQQRPFFGKIALFTARIAFQDKDMAKASQLADVAMRNPEVFENALGTKIEILESLGQNAEVKRILDSIIVKSPNSYIAWVEKGLYYLRKKQYKEVADNLKEAQLLKPDNAVIAEYIGYAYVEQARNIDDENQKKALYKEAIYYYDKAKSLDPYMQQANWGYMRYHAYYNYYGADAPETKQAEQMSHWKPSLWMILLENYQNEDFRNKIRSYFGGLK